MFELSEKSIKNLPEMNEKLLEVTNKINQYHQNAKNSILAISLILAEIAEKPNKYLSGSFDNIVDYAKDLFGYKKDYTYKLIRISRFIKLKDKTGENLPVDYLINDKMVDQLIENDNFISFNTLKDSDGFEFSTSQLLELLPLSKSEIEANIEVLDSSLSCKELRQIVKDIKNPPIEITATDSSTDSSTDSTTDSTQNIEETEKVLTDKDRILQMLEICSCMENEEIKQIIINVFEKALKKLK